jgi:hypothetical protein
MQSGVSDDFIRAVHCYGGAFFSFFQDLYAARAFPACLCNLWSTISVIDESDSET